MRFHQDGPLIPDSLLERRDAGRVVFLCGAGVSFNSELPTFLSLTKHVVEFFDPPADSEIIKAFNPWLTDESTANVPLDQIFNLLHDEYGRDEVNALVTERLKTSPTAKGIGHEHGLIKRISSSRDGVPQVVTTNFDHLFEHNDRNITYHVPPNFPDLELGMKLSGIIYLHGRLASSDVDNYPYVLSSADLGRAYLSEAWATRFIRGLLERYTVVLVGYRAEDPPMKYLLQGLNRGDQLDSDRLFAFDQGKAEDIEVNWRDKGVTSIAYQCHEHLWQTMRAWADRADDPRAWRRTIVHTATQDPKVMAAHERGQVAHALRSVPGARLFADIDPPPHPEWICVLDAFTRNAKQCGKFGKNHQTFEPALAYGFNDDIRPIRDDDYLHGIKYDNLLEWQHGDDYPTEVHRIGGLQMRGREAVPRRIGHIIRWIQKVYASPAIAWWAARQQGLHPRLIDCIERQLEHDGEIDERCRHVWNLILESQRDGRNRDFMDISWYNLKKRIETEGWTHGVLRDFRSACEPRLDISSPVGLHMCKPPTSSWSNLRLSDIGTFEVKYMDRSNEELEVPDEVLSTVFRILEEQLLSIAKILPDIEGIHLNTPTFYPNRESDGGEQNYAFTEPMMLFAELLDKLAVVNPQAARARTMLWDENDKYFFRKLKLYSLSNADLFETKDMVSIVLSFNQDAFWDIDVVRELLFLLVDRWIDISMENRKTLGKRILAGPNKRDDWLEQEYPRLRDEYAARYGRYLQMQGCDFDDVHSVKLNKMIAKIKDWNDGWATSLVMERGVHGGFIGTDVMPDVLMGLSLSNIVPRAEAELTRDFSNLTERKPFIGLVKENPRKALSALSIHARQGDFPEFAWTTLIDEFPKDIVPRLYRLFLNRLTRLPNALIVALRHSVGRWVKENLSDVIEFDADLGWKVYDHFVMGILSGGQKATESGLGQSFQGDEVIRQSPRTYSHAINGALGNFIQALLLLASRRVNKSGSRIPSDVKARIEQILNVRGAGYDHAVSILMRDLNWIMHIDPEWAKEHLTPVLVFEHSASEPAWSGFLHAQHLPSIDVVSVIKPLIQNLCPSLEDFDWSDDASMSVVGLLGHMNVFRSGEVDGLDDREMRSIIRNMSEDVRIQMINWLIRVGKGDLGYMNQMKQMNGWSEFVIPFINKVWPRERKFRTKAAVSHWIRLLDRTASDFPTVYEAVKKFLVPIDNVWFYCLVRDVKGERSLALRYPEPALDLMNTLNSEKLSQPLADLPKTLELIEESDPKLVSDRRYLRLIDLVERS